MRDWAIALFFFFVVFPVVGALYVAFVHWLGARVVRLLPLPLARVFGFKLWTTEWDTSRKTDLIRKAIRDKQKREGKAVEGDLLPRQ